MPEIWFRGNKIWLSDLNNRLSIFYTKEDILKSNLIGFVSSFLNVVVTPDCRAYKVVDFLRCKTDLFRESIRYFLAEIDERVIQNDNYLEFLSEESIWLPCNNFFDLDNILACQFVFTVFKFS